MRKDGGLPLICKNGRSTLERKLLYYMHYKAEYPVELRVLHSTGFQREDVPPLQYPFEFVPLSEIGYRIFMFKTALDRDRARKAFANDVSHSDTKRSRRNRG